MQFHEIQGHVLFVAFDLAAPAETVASVDPVLDIRIALTLLVLAKLTQIHHESPLMQIVIQISGALSVLSTGDFNRNIIVHFNVHCPCHLFLDLDELVFRDNESVADVAELAGDVHVLVDFEVVEEFEGCLVFFGSFAQVLDEFVEEFEGEGLGDLLAAVDHPAELAVDGAGDVGVREAGGGQHSGLAQFNMFKIRQPDLFINIHNKIKIQLSNPNRLNLLQIIHQTLRHTLIRPQRLPHNLTHLETILLRLRGAHRRQRHPCLISIQPRLILKYLILILVPVGKITLVG